MHAEHRACDKGANAFCSLQAVVVDERFATSTALIASQRAKLLAAGWTGNLDLDRTYEFSRQFESRVEAVTADQLVSVARKYLDLSKMTIVVAGDAKKGAH